MVDYLEVHIDFRVRYYRYETRTRDFVCDGEFKSIVPVCAVIPTNKLRTVLPTRNSSFSRCLQLLPVRSVNCILRSQFYSYSYSYSFCFCFCPRSRPRYHHLLLNILLGAMHFASWVLFASAVIAGIASSATIQSDRATKSIHPHAVHREGGGDELDTDKRYAERIIDWSGPSSVR